MKLKLIGHWISVALLSAALVACGGGGSNGASTSKQQSLNANTTVDLTVGVQGAGSVTGGGQTCAADSSCTVSINQGDSVTMTATPSANHVFAGWTGACTGQTVTCSVTMDQAKSVTASFAQTNSTLSLSIAGSGSVSSAPAGVSCSASCSPSLAAGDTYVLTATPGANQVFVGWGGACSGTATCSVTMDAAKAVSANFVVSTKALTLTLAGTGSVSSNPAGVACSASCVTNATTGTAYVLTATPGTGQVFTGWSGAAGCTGTGTCAVTMDAAKSVTATFTLGTQTLSLTVVGTGSVSSSPAGVSCSATCSTSLTASTSYTLTATPGANQVFVGWGGVCSGTGTCVVTMDAAKAVTANFAVSTKALTLTIAGTGSVSSAPTGVACSVSCVTTAVTGTAYVLTATPGTGQVFSGWSGAAGCTGTGTCAVTMDAAKSVTATFTLGTQALSLSISGSGAVSSSPTGVSCSSAVASTTCPSTALPWGGNYTLTATPATGFSFTGWGGACSGTGTCAVTMSAARSVTATFTQITYSLGLSIVGTGSVASTPAGVSCASGTCTSTLNATSSYTLVATPGANQVFVGWGGTAGCAGSGTCVVTMDGNKTVTASFAASVKALTLTIAGTGSVSSSPAGVACSVSCVTNATTGAAYVLTATPGTGQVFTGWSGAAGCTGTGTCSVTMDAAKAVSATFALAPQTLSLTIVGTGSVASSPAGIACAASCAPSLTANGTYVLTATPGTNQVFVGWSGACSGTGTCSVTMDSAKDVSASFAMSTKALTLTIAGTGSVSSSPTGVACSVSCVTTAATGSAYVLTATPGTGQVFSGWSGAAGCTGTGTCSVTLDAAKAVTATFAAAPQTLSLTIVGTGSVASSPAGVACSASCSTSLTAGTALVLTATPGTNQVFVGWGGLCSGTGTCSVTMDAAKAVTANFAVSTKALTLTISGTGSVSSAPTGVACSVSCVTNATTGTAYVLTATPGTGQVFTGWSGTAGCTGTGTCSVTMDAAKAVSATFGPAPQTLTLTIVGTGSVASNPAGVSCSVSCAPSLPASTAYVLTATPGTNQVFVGWGGLCSGTGTCSVTMDAAKAVTANFAVSTKALTLTISGTGSVSSAPTGVACSVSCVTNATTGTAYVLTATPGTGQIFTGWSGTAGCTGTGSCSVTMDAAKAVTATFALAPQTLSLTLAGSGSGSVASSPAGVSCTATCAPSLTGNGTYVLTATVGANSVFTGWSGAAGCTGTGTCSVTMSAAKAVIATFTPTTKVLTLTISGTGSVGSTPTGIACSTSCTTTLNTGSAYTLTATPGANQVFSGWSGTGGCTGTGTCAVTMDAAKAVTATFTAAVTTQTLSVSVSGTGSVSPVGSGTCSTGTCTASLNTGSAVTLTATPGTGYTFAGWSGACAGTGTCALTMSAAQSVTATFTATVADACTNVRSTATTATFSSTHPKVLLNNAATVACLRQMLNNGTASATRFKNYVDSEVASPGYNYGFSAWFAAMMWQLKGDTKYADLAVSMVDASVAAQEALIANNQASDVAYDSYLYVGDWITDIALTYDWCYDRLTPTQRTRWINFINTVLTNLWNPDTAKWGNTTYAWSGWGTLFPGNNYFYSFMRATMMGGLATANDNSQAQSWITMFRTTKVANAAIPLFNSDLVGGGSKEGTNYGIAQRHMFMLYDWWERSTGERIATLTPHTLASSTWMMHAIVPTLDRMVVLGDEPRDSTASLYDYERTYLLTLMNLFPTERITGMNKILLDNSSVTSMSKTFEYWADFMYEPHNVPSATITDLNPTYWASGTGNLFMRSVWGDRTAAYANFVCGPYVEDHQHHDQSSFQIYKGEWLAQAGPSVTESGLLKTEDWLNVVRFVKAGTLLEQKQGKAPCVMKAVADNSVFTYGVADVAGVYDTTEVAKDQREFLFIKPSTFIVFDRVTVATASTQRIWALNLPGTPTISGDRLTYTGAGGNKLDVFRQAPSGLSYTVNQYTLPDWGDYFLNPDARRIDVVDATTGTSSNFLHVMGTNSSVSAATRSDGTGQIGTTITLADGRTVTVRFNTATTGGTLTVQSGSTTQFSGSLPTTVTATPVFLN